VRGDREGRQRRFVEARQDQLLLAGVRIDVAHREHARDAGLELLGVHLDRALVDPQAPLGDRSQLRVQAEEHQRLVGANLVELAVETLHAHAAESVALGEQRVGHSLDIAHAAVSHEVAHLRHRGGLRPEVRTPVHQRHAARLAHELQRPVERRVAAAEDHQVLAGEVAGTLHLVMNVPAFEGFAAFQAEAARLERAESAGDDHRPRVKARIPRSRQQEGVVGQHLQPGHFLAHVELRVERLRLLQQAVDQLLRPAHGQRRNVVDGLLGIQLAALPAWMLERVDDVRMDAEQAELEDLKQATGAGADDDDIGLDGAVHGAAVGTLGQECSPA
jgi:hypothetical protein